MPYYDHPMPTLALLDGHSLAYRAFYALPKELSTDSGEVTNAVFGFTSMLIKLLADRRPDGVVVAWDTGRSTFRTERYPDYKAQRASTPDLFRNQLPLIEEVLEAWQIPQLRAPGFEADDVIATMAKDAGEAGWEVLVVTGDRDSFQLVSPRVRVMYTLRGISDTLLVDEAQVKEKYGIEPIRYLDYAALRGDNSDNLPGVPGVGEKTAARLLQEHGNLEAIFDNVDAYPPRLRKNLAEHQDQVLLNRSLMSLVDNLDLDITADLYLSRDPDRARLRELFGRLQFETLWERLREQLGDPSLPEAARPEVEVEICSGVYEVSEIPIEMGLVVEPVYEAGDLVGLVLLPLSSSSEPVRCYFVPPDLFHALHPVLADPTTPLVAHRSKILDHYLAGFGATLAGVVFDPELAGYLLKPESRSESLAHMAARWLRINLEKAEAGDLDAHQGAFDFGAGPDLVSAGVRAAAIRDLQEVMEASLVDRGQLSLLREMEMPLVPILARMERLGIAVDTDYLAGLNDRLGRELAELRQAIHGHAGAPFNINSSPQLGKVLFEDLGLPTVKKTPRGRPSTDASVLEKLKDSHPIVDGILQFREVEKIRSTYVKSYLSLIGSDGRLHARFNQTGASTGRLSSDRPNLQNIPVRSELGRTVRRAFVAGPGFRFLVADYSQIELRVLAHLSEDPGLLEAFDAGADIHTATAARVFGIPEGEVTTHERRRAKAINFGLLYGMESYGLAERLKISREEARDHMDTYFRQFPLVNAYLGEVVERARRDGYTTTIFGRRRYLPELTSDNWRTRQMGERMALNAPVQGSAADIIKMAMIELDQLLPPQQTRMLLQIHDELVFEVADRSQEDAIAQVRHVMEGVVELRVPLTVDVGVGTNLADTKGD